jgi:hypothetical protein
MLRHKRPLGDFRKSPDGTKFITSDGYRVHIWDISGELITSIDVATNYVELSKDGSQILLTTEHDVQLWDIEGNILNTFVATNGETILSRATFNPTESRIRPTTIRITGVCVVCVGKFTVS